MSTDSVILKTPENTSILQTTKFTFVIPDLPFARYFCQTVSLPGVSTTPMTVSIPFATNYRHGHNLDYEAFAINTVVDEDLRVWEETYKWLVQLTSPITSRTYASNIHREKYYDGILTINTNANNPNIRVKFKNVHPISIGSIQFNTSDNADTTPTADIGFRYDYFEIERV
jgi:hypothetical protein